MHWKASPPAIEIIVSTVAAALLGGAVAFAVAGLAPLGAGALGAGAVGALVAVAALLILWRVDRRGSSAERFVPEPLADLFADDQATVPGDRVASVPDAISQQDDGDDEALLLDDPLPAPAASRVVRLFAAAPDGSGDAAPTFAAPGEMVARIADFLDQGRGGAAMSRPEAQRPSTGDASAALHAALADIRRSLRQG